VALRSALGDLPVLARTVVEAFVRLSTYVHAPAELDAKAALDQLRLSQSGTIYVDGGWSSVVDGLLNSAILARALVRTRECVERVRSKNERCSVHLKSGQSEDFEAVILAVSPNQARAIADSSAQLAAEVPTMRPVRIMCLDLALSTLPRNDANFALGMDRPTYLSVHSAVSKLAPPSGALVHVARYLAPDEKPSTQHFDELERVADELQPDWRNHLVDKQRLAGITVAHDFPRWADESRRIVSSVSDVPGVFLAGDWVGPAGMLADAAAASARAAAEEAIRYVIA
jgi:phytoene dehydrogenase-like protein